MAEVEDWEHISCSLCYASNDFRVLDCGHTFCMGCLQCLRKRHGKKIPCPRDRIIDRRELSELLEPHECQGEVIISSIDEERYMNLNQLIDAEIKDRMVTIKMLKSFARRFKWLVRLLSLAFWCGGVIGAFCLPCLITASTDVNAKDRSYSYSSCGALAFECSALLCFVIFCRNLRILSPAIRRTHAVLKSDYLKAEQISVILERAVVDPAFAKNWQIDSEHITGDDTVLREPSNTAITDARGSTDDDEMDGLLDRYLLNAAAHIPDDLVALSKSSLADICTCGRSIGRDTIDLAERLDKDLKIYLVGARHFNLVKTNDGKWVFILVRAEKLQQFRNELSVGFSLEQLEEYGKIIEKGEGELPNDIRKKIGKEWYSHYDELVKIHYPRNQVTRRRIRAANNSAVAVNDDGLTTNYGCVNASDGCISGNDGCLTSNGSCVPANACCITANDSNDYIANALATISDAGMTSNSKGRQQQVNVIAQSGSTVQIGSGGTITHIHNYNTICSSPPVSDDDANGTTQDA